MQSHLLMIGITSTLLLIKNKSKEKESWKNKLILTRKLMKNLLRYFQGDELAARVWVNKYAVKDSFWKYLREVSERHALENSQ